MSEQGGNRRWANITLRIVTIVWIVIAVFFTLIAGRFAVDAFIIKKPETILVGYFGALMYFTIAVGLWVGLIFFRMCRQDD